VIAVQDYSSASLERIQAQDFTASFHAAICSLVPRGRPFLLRRPSGCRRPDAFPRAREDTMAFAVTLATLAATRMSSES